MPRQNTVELTRHSKSAATTDQVDVFASEQVNAVFLQQFLCQRIAVHSRLRVVTDSQHNISVSWTGTSRDNL